MALWLLGIFLMLLIVLYLAITLFCMCNVQPYRVYDESGSRLERRDDSQTPRAAPAPRK